MTLYSRDYCHLCHAMLAALEALRDERGDDFDIDVVDVEVDPALLQRFDELVPVLVALDGVNIRELCHYFLDREAVQGYLASLSRRSAAPGAACITKSSAA